MTEQPDFTRLPDEVTLDQTIELDETDRWAGAGGGGDLGVADCDGD